MSAFANFVGSTEQRTIAAGDYVFREDDPSNGLMYALLEGRISITRKGKLLERIDREGGVFGEIALIDDLPRAASAVADVETRVAAISEERFRELTLRNPSFALAMMRLLVSRIRANLEEPQA